MSKLLKQLVRQRVRDFHNENVALSESDPSIEPGLKFYSGFRATAPAKSDTSRKMRRVFERRMVKQLAKQGLR